MRDTIKHCEITGQAFTVPGREIDICRSFGFPPPSISPEERFRRLFAFRNHELFFWRVCSVTGQQIYSVYPPSCPFPVVSDSYWQSDEWEPFDYGEPFDLDRPFLDQLLDLWIEVPRPALLSQLTTNTSSADHVRQIRDCLLLFDAEQVTRGFYSVSLRNCEDCGDCYRLLNCSFCFECIHCRSSRRLRWSEFCDHCENSAFLSHCTNCRNCLFCANLNGKEFHVWNKQVSSEEFERLSNEWNLTARQKVELAKEEFNDFLSQYPVPHIIAEPFENISGNYLYGCSNVRDSFECFTCHDLAHCHGLTNSDNCFDGVFGEKVEQSALFVAVGMNAKNVVNSIECWNNVENLAYCSYCEDSRNLLGCVGLEGKEYCIFNVQYKKVEYEELRCEIVGHLKARGVWGRFLPSEFSAFPFNCSSANILMPLGEIPAKLLGYRWDETVETLLPSQLAQTIEKDLASRFQDVPERLEDLDPIKDLDKLYICEISGQPFRYIKYELDLYRSLGIAPPTRCFEQRHRERMNRLSPFKLTMRQLTSGAEVQTSFPSPWRRPVVAR